MNAFTLARTPKIIFGAGRFAQPAAIVTKTGKTALSVAEASSHSAGFL